MRKLSRQILARTTAAALVGGEERTRVFDRLAAFLVHTGRTNEGDLILRDVEYYLAEAGYVAAIVTSATPLKAQERSRIEADITSQTSAKYVSVSEIVDPLMVGGTKVELPGRTRDRSAARVLTNFKAAFN